MIRICGYCGLVYDKEEQGYNKYCSDKCTTGIRRDRNRDRWRKEKGFEMVGDEVGRACQVCGADMVGRRIGAIFCSKACRGKAMDRKTHRTMKEWVAERRVELDHQILETKKRKDAERQAKIMTKECAECGMNFKTLNNKVLTCSPECSKSRSNRLSWMRKNKKLNDGNIVDRDISLKVLYKRDKGICYICGDPCDYDDYTVDENNNFTSGYKYPSIDHLIPIARGGKHAWDNVRLAHHHCNSVKSDSLPEDIKNLIPEDAYIFARKVSQRSKQVNQYTSNGKTLIATYKSTFEAERMTGVKAKAIQKVARGEQWSTCGYWWSYV